MPALQALAGVPSFGGQLGKALGSGFGEGLQQGINTRLTEMLKTKKIDQLEKEYVTRGMPKPFARLAAISTTGGQTEITKYVLDQLKRSEDPNLQEIQNQQQMEAPQQQMGEQAPDQVQKQVVKSKQIASPDLGLTPTERVAREKERYGTNLPIFQETTTKLRDIDKTHNLINVMEKIEDSGDLPEGLSRINVDKEGNLVLPFLASSGAQRYVKTLNEFSSGAKDTFGSRVTNFDLTQYLRRFPTLLNTEEGRRQIYDQMRIVNDINKEYYSTLRDVYKEVGGVRKIDADQAESIAEERSKDKVDQLSKRFEDIGKSPEKKFQVGQEFNKLPKASEMKGVTITLPSGEDIRSNGKKWTKVK